MNTLLTFAIGLFTTVISYNFISWYFGEISMKGSTENENENDTPKINDETFLPCTFPEQHINSGYGSSFEMSKSISHRRSY